MDTDDKREKTIMRKKLFAAIAVIIVVAICASVSGCEPEREVEFAYVYSDKETVTPYWENVYGDYTVVYNEVVSPVSYGVDATTATGYLTYEPYRIISVRDCTLEREYTAGEYTLSGNALSVPTDGSMPYICNEWLDFKNIPEEFKDFMVESPSAYNDKGGTNKGKHVITEGSLTRSNCLYVTYAYDSSKQETGFEKPVYQPENFGNLLEKLSSATPVKILVFGDSIFTGASASGVVGFPPGLPAFFDLIKSNLADRYYGGDESKITLVNQSVGGTLSDWGVEQVENKAFDVSGYDFVMIGFGMNDGCESFDTSPTAFANNIKRIVEGIREGSPNADYLVIGSFTPNPKSIFAGNHADFIKPVSEMCVNELNAKDSGCTYFSMYEMSLAILQNKQKNNPEDGRYQYVDLSSNYTNHPNDFTVRLYAGAILSLFNQFDSAAHVA